MSATATPRATPAWWTDLDRNVYKTLSPVKPQRCDVIAKRVRENPTLVRGVLRGLEHLGHATCRNGWWRRTA